MSDTSIHLTALQQKIVKGLKDEFNFDEDYIIKNFRYGQIFRVTNKYDLGKALYEDEFCVKLPVQLLGFVDFESYAEERLYDYEVLNLGNAYFVWGYRANYIT